MSILTLVLITICCTLAFSLVLQFIYDRYVEVKERFDYLRDNIIRLDDRIDEVECDVSNHYSKKGELNKAADKLHGFIQRKWEDKYDHLDKLGYQAELRQKSTESDVRNIMSNLHGMDDDIEKLKSNKGG